MPSTTPFPSSALAPHRPVRVRAPAYRRSPLRWLPLIATLLLAGCFGGGSDDDGTPSVGVSIPPHAWLVERLAGDAVQIHVAVPPGASPATHQPSDADMLALKRCALYIRTGVPMEQGPWFASLGDGSRIVDARSGVELREMEHHSHGHADHDHAHHDHDHNHAHHEHEHEHEHANAVMAGADPHIWLAPDTLLIQVDTIATALRELLPERATAIDAAATQLRDELQELDAELQQRFVGHDDKTMLVYHPSWGYLARRYGFTMRSIEIAGKDPTDAELATLESELAELHTDTLFVQPQIHGRGADRLAEALALEVVRIDPLRRDVPANLRQTANLLLRSWGDESP
ncbi:MAG: metal ABC transporter solute-binding protein, Zn/Mn family [Planctomycetota bacterium]